MDHNTPPAPQAFAELLVEHNLDMRQVLGHLAAMAAPQAVNQAPIKTEAPPPHRIHLDEIGRFKEQSDRLITRSTTTFKKGVIQPELKGLPRELAHVEWTWSINTNLTNCTFADVLIDVVQVLDKHNTNYMDIHRFCKQHYFNQDLNSRKCAMHQADSYVTEATYTVLMDQFCRWGIFMMLQSWEQATPPVEAKTIYMPVIKTFNATLAAARRDLYNQNINTTNYRHRRFKGRWMSKEKGPIAKRTWSSRAHHKAESDKEEEEEEEGDNNNSNGEEDDNAEEEEEED